MVMAGSIWRRIVRFWPRLEPAVVKPLLAGCLPFLLAFLLGFMDTKVDVLMLSLVKGPVEASLAIGYYGPAHTILMGLMLLPRSLNQVLVPVVSQQIYEDQAAVRDIVEKATKFVMLAVSFPVILATAMFSEQIVGILFGSQYGPTARRAGDPGMGLRLLCAQPSFPFRAGLDEGDARLSSRARRLVRPERRLEPPPDPPLQLSRRGDGSTVVLALGFCCRFYFLHRILDMRLSAARPYLKLFLILLLTLAAGYAIRPRLPWMLAAVVIALVYGGLLHALRAVEPEEWRFFLGLLRRRVGNEAPGGGAATEAQLPAD